MGKKADKYFKTDPWRILEEGFDPAYAKVAESVFSLANEYMGVRGYFEEGSSCETLVGSYFGGVYEQKKQEGPSYRGMVDTTEFMVNSVNWLYTRLEAGGERLEPGSSRISGFSRCLDMKTGLLTRHFIWCLADGKKLDITMERILSMSRIRRAAQRITIQSLNFEGTLKVWMGLDGSVVQESVGENFWNTREIREEGDDLLLEQETLHTKQRVCAAARLVGTEWMAGTVCGDGGPGAAKVRRTAILKEEKKTAFLYELQLKPSKTVQFQRRVCNLVYRAGASLMCGDREEADWQEYQDKKAKWNICLESGGLEEILEENRDWWHKIWEKCDIELYGDPENQQGIRFCIFQLFQTYHGAVKGSNIGAKGLTGEAYNGNAFWDTETYCLPFFLFHDRRAAENLLYFRYQTLGEARKRARELDCAGAFYPVATISGRECCNLWQHASLQLQASTAVAYGIWLYEKMTENREFLWQQGMEMLTEISRMLADRGDYSPDGQHYGFYGVMGPDEFQMMVNHNCYTNYMGRFTLRYTLECMALLRRQDEGAWSALAVRLGYQEAEGRSWQRMADCMYIPQQGLLYEQHQGFFALPHVAVDQIPVADFPLYSHWSYDRIYRNDMIKQPDVLMLMLLFNGSFTEEELRCNYDYYEPRCIHESSLSPSVHSILACQLGRQKEACDFFRFATRMDLDNYNRNSGEGIHTTSIAAAWMNIVYGFGGLRSDGELLQLNPVLPDLWEGYTFRLCIREDVLTVRVDRSEVSLEMAAGEAVELLLYGEKVRTGARKVIRRIRKRAEDGLEHTGNRI